MSSVEDKHFLEQYAEIYQDAARYRHARWHAMKELLSVYKTPDTSDVGLDFAIDLAIEREKKL